MRKRLLITILLLSFIHILSAQVNIEEVDLIDYTKISLPPLQTLFENAKNSPSVGMYEAKMHVQDNQLLSEKRSWLKYFRVGGSYQYGNIAVNSAFTNEYTPLFYQSSGATQSSWYGTAGIAIPFDDFFDRKNRIKRQKMERQSTELEMEKWLDEQKVRIAVSYSRARAAISTLQRTVQDYALAQAAYKSVENDFKLGHASIGDLNVAKKMESESFQAVKNNESLILSEILSLEILSRTKIISK